MAAVQFMRSWGNMQGVTLISTLAALALVVGLAYVTVAPRRYALPPTEFRRLFGRNLYRLSAWALGGYMVYMVIVSTVLTLVGFKYPR